MPRPKLYLLPALFLSLTIILTVCQTSFSKTDQLEAYFSPDGHIKDRIINAIDNSNTSIDIAIFDFTSFDLKASLERAKTRGVNIRIIADSEQAKGPRSVIQSLVNEGFKVKITNGKEQGIMHNKFAIFDKKLLVTGSYNWTESAEHYNYENAIFISDTETIKKYQQEFDSIYNLP